MIKHQYNLCASCVFDFHHLPQSSSQIQTEVVARPYIFGRSQVGSEEG